MARHRELEERHQRRLTHRGCCIDMGGGGDDKPPEADPRIAAAAGKQLELGDRLLTLAEEDRKWAMDRYNEIAPTLKELQGQQIEVGRRGLERDAELWDRYRTIYMPNEEKYAAAVDAYDTPERREQEAARAASGVGVNFAAQEENLGRDMARYGIKPQDAQLSRMRIAQAGTQATAANEARRDTEMRGIALRGDLANYGRGVPAQANASTQLGLAGAGGAQAGIAAETANRSASVNSSLPWYVAGGGQYSNAAGILSNQHQQEMSAWNTQQNREAQESAGIGSLVGTVVGGVGGWMIGGPVGASVGASAGSKLSSKKYKRDKRPVRYVTSSERAKHGGRTLDGEAVLVGIERAPVESWRYKEGIEDGGAERHVGPYAEDMQREFGDRVAPGGEMIDVAEEVGIALAGVQALSAKVRRLEKAVGIGGAA